MQQLLQLLSVLHVTSCLLAPTIMQVIEYIRFLQEKVQKYEVSYPEWNQENAKTVPWANMYFRSFWKNAQVNLHSANTTLCHTRWGRANKFPANSLTTFRACSAEQGPNTWRYIT